MIDDTCMGKYGAHRIKRSVGVSVPITAEQWTVETTL